MKKIISLILMLSMVFALAACGGSTASTTATEAPAAEEPAAEAPAEEPAAEEPAAEGAAEYTLGMGVVSSFGSSKTGNAQIDTTFAAVVTDAEGKIVMARIDVAQNKMNVTDGVLTLGGDYRTKMEKGTDYGMQGVSAIGAEWDAQAKAFEEYVVGMTADDVAAIETVLNDSNHNVPTDEVLLAGCTMDIVAFKEAIAKACADEWAVTFTAEAGSFTLGAAASTEDASSTEATEDADAVVKMHTEFGAAVVGADGTILAALNDAIQPNITVDAAGEIVETVYKGTKRELGEDYGMTPASAIGVEWDAQSAAFSAYVVGMTADQVAGLETAESNGHQISVDETLLTSCTMDITGMMAVIAQAANYAR